MARGFSEIPARMVRICRVPGLWEELPECGHCEGQGECEVEYAVPDYRTGSGFIDTRHGECPVCHGRGYVELTEGEEE